jgi:hypothetical protein
LERGIVSGPDHVGFSKWFICSEGYSLMPDQNSPGKTDAYLLSAVLSIVFAVLHTNRFIV